MDPAARTWNPRETAAQSLPTAPALPRHPRGPGLSIGPFELVRLLGSGATGEVWEAVDRRVDAPVALKLFTGCFSVLSRVMDEARAASRVISDHVVYVREAGEIEGMGYIAMALCREETASDAAPQVARAMTEEPPRSLAEAVAWGEQIARGVAAAHAAGVYHRDLKPENVLVLPGSRRVRIADFGLSPLRGNAGAFEGDEDVPLTVPVGMSGLYAAGTPLYMAPEQARGFMRAPDPARDAAALAAIDVYGLGATIWALLTGRAPHATMLDEPAEVVRRRAALGPPPPLDEVETLFKVPRRLARIIERAMAPDPAVRHPSAAALAVDLACWRANRATSIDSPWAPVRFPLWIRRHPARMAATAWIAALTMGLSAGTAVLERWRLATEELEVAEARLHAVRAETRVLEAHASSQLQRAAAATAALFGGTLPDVPLAQPLAPPSAPPASLPPRWDDSSGAGDAGGIAPREPVTPPQRPASGGGGGASQPYVASRVDAPLP
jgi:serine/threonine protein kinase